MGFSGFGHGTWCFSNLEVLRHLSELHFLRFLYGISYSNAVFFQLRAPPAAPSYSTQKNNEQ